MREMLWVHREFFDTSLDRTTWVEMARALRDLGYVVRMVCSYEHSPVELPTFEEVKWVPPAGPGFIRRSRFFFLAWLEVLRACIAHPPDLIILDAWTAPVAFPFDLGRRLFGRGPRVVLDLRTTEWGAQENRLSLRDLVVREMCRLAFAYNRVMHDGLTAINERLAEAARGMGARREIGVWGSGVPDVFLRIEHDRASPPVVAARSAESVAVYHGSLGANRGLQQAIGAVDILSSEGADIVFWIVGTGREEAALREAAKNTVVPGCVVVADPLPAEEIPALLARADLALMVYPDLRYWDYNHPIKLVEYLAAGIPVVCSDIPCFRAVDPAGDYLTYSSTEPQALATVIRACLSAPAGMEPRSKAGRQYAASQTWDAQARRLLSSAGLDHADNQLVG